MKRLVSTIRVGVGLMAVLLLVSAADYYWGILGLVEQRRSSSVGNSPESLPSSEELDLETACRPCWSTIESNRSGPEPVAKSSGLAGEPVEFADHVAENAVDFTRDVRPIFVEYCYECHGPDEQLASIRFDDMESLYREAESGQKPIVPGDAETSSLMERVTSHDEDLRMPAGRAPLTPDDISILQTWIERGAVSPAESRHWAFVLPRQPPLPEASDCNWPRNPIDHFVLERLDREGLAPSPAAARTTLIRRLSLDLTGLPPSVDEVDRFLDDRSDDAYEKVVDRLLLSPRYGERWAVRWLDLARYADTNGFGYDAPRQIWLYRDWVIHAFNTDKPFDVFTVEQLAGDLLPGSTSQQKVATGFVRSSAVQADAAQQRFEVMVDRVNTVGTVWLGLSIGCAQCHDHKFDPVTQKEYFQLYAMFNNSIQEVKDGKQIEARFEARSPIDGFKSSTLILEESEQPNISHLKIRGGYLNDGEQVQPGVPASFHPPACAAQDRLGLACWLVDPANPLTARVTANRFWEAIFGVGLVRTSEDLGTRCEVPSHPELLDWLATEFKQNGWSIKRLLKLMVMSATYRQTSTMTAGMLARDPDNRLLARGPRFRVDAEFVRDIVLAASGTLNDKVGGPSVFPPQPRGISEERLFGKFNWRTSRDESRYRRGLYTYLKRSAMYPSFAILDAPSRTVACARRTRSTTPLQALTTLNDPAFFEAAVSLGRRLMSEAGPETSERVSYGFRLCVSRRPTSHELDRLVSYYREEQERMKRDPSAAKQLVGGDNIGTLGTIFDVTEWAAWTMVANAMLNLDETITKD